MPIMRKIVEKLVRLQIKALHLGGDPSPDLDDRQFYHLGLSGSGRSFQQVEERSIFAEFEHSIKKAKR